MIRLMISYRFLLMMGPQLLRLRCNYDALKSQLEAADLDFVYSLGLYLTVIILPSLITYRHY